MTKAKKEGGLWYQGAANVELDNAMQYVDENVGTERSLLWVRVIKILYFPNTDFMHAAKGSRASWGWANLLNG